MNDNPRHNLEATTDQLTFSPLFESPAKCNFPRLWCPRSFSVFVFDCISIGAGEVLTYKSNVLYDKRYKRRKSGIERSFQKTSHPWAFFSKSRIKSRVISRIDSNIFQPLYLLMFMFVRLLVCFYVCESSVVCFLFVINFQ